MNVTHTGCTTGAEAVAMGHPTTSIQEKGNELVRLVTTNHVSYLTHTAEEDYRAVQNFYAGKLLKLGDASKLREFWPAQEVKFAAERIVDEIYQFYSDLGGAFDGFKPVSVQFEELVLTDFHNSLHEISCNMFYINPV